MTRKDFLERLKRLMKDMDEKERQDVLDYYRDYMDDAGIQENDSVDGMFDSPEKIVSTLRSSLKEEAIESEKAAPSEKELVKKDTSVNNDSAKKKKRSIGKLALIILLILIAVPVALGTCGLHAYRNMRMSGVVRFDDWNDQYDVDILDDFDDRYDDGHKNHHDVDDIKNNQKSLIVDMDLGQLTIKKTDAQDAYLEVNDSKDEKHFQLLLDNDFITVSAQSKHILKFGIDVPEAILYLPENYIFETVKLDMDAGSCHIETSLNTEKFYADVDAGNVSVQKMTTDWLEFDCDAGNITFDGSVNVGGFVDCDAGNVELTIDGKRVEGYNYDIDVELGEFTLNDQIFSGMRDSRYLDHQAQGTWKIQCDVGKIQFQMNP